MSGRLPESASIKGPARQAQPVCRPAVGSQCGLKPLSERSQYTSPASASLIQDLLILSSVPGQQPEEIQIPGLEGDQLSELAQGTAHDPKTGPAQTSLSLLVPQPGGGAWPEEVLLLVELAIHNFFPWPAPETSPEASSQVQSHTPESRAAQVPGQPPTPQRAVFPLTALPSLRQVSTLQFPGLFRVTKRIALFPGKPW